MYNNSWIKDDNDFLNLYFKGNRSLNLPTIAIVNTIQSSLNFIFSLVDTDNLFNMEFNMEYQYQCLSNYIYLTLNQYLKAYVMF